MSDTDTLPDELRTRAVALEEAFRVFAADYDRVAAERDAALKAAADVGAVVPPPVDPGPIVLVRVRFGCIQTKDGSFTKDSDPFPLPETEAFDLQAERVIEIVG